MITSRSDIHDSRLLRLAALLSLLLIAAALPCRAGDAAGTFHAFCYHDIRDKLRDTQAQHPDDEALDTADLVGQFSWLRDNGYVPVSLDRIAAARAGGPPLPERAVLLTFDDGLKSVRTKVFPLLQLFNYPAVIGLVTEWMEVAPGGQVKYGDERLPREALVTWDEVREMTASGLVEVASHTHDLHRAIVGNPQGGRMPATTTRLWLGSAQGYESDTAYRARLADDLRTSVDIIARRTGKAPRALIWPYGEYNRDAIDAAARSGLTIALNLEAGPNLPDQPLTRIRRTLVRYDTGIADLIAEFRRPSIESKQGRPVERVVRVDLDGLYDADPARQENNLGQLLERILDLHPSTVYLKAYADPAAAGEASALYFPNRHLPMRADLFSRAAWQLRTRAGVKVFAAMPIAAFRLPGRTAPASREQILDLYRDLGRSGRFAGIVFDVDGAPAAGSDWAVKPALLAGFTVELADALRAEQPTLISVQELSLANAARDAVGPPLGDSLTRALKLHDYVALRDLGDRAAGIERVLEDAAAVPGALARTVFELASREPASGRDVPSARLADRMALLHAGGARNFGYYPDAWQRNRPALDALKPVMSLENLYRVERQSR